MQFPFRVFPEEFGLHGGISRARFCGAAGGFFEDIANALEGSGQWNEVFRFTDSFDRCHAFGGVHQIIATGCERGVDFVVGVSVALAQDVIARVRG